MDEATVGQALTVALALSVTISGVVLNMLRVEKKNHKNSRGNPGQNPQPCMQGGTLMTRFTDFLSSNSNDMRDLKDALTGRDGIREVLLDIRNRVGRE